jgi:hypothetical protein
MSSSIGELCYIAITFDFTSKLLLFVSVFLIEAYRQQMSIAPQHVQAIVILQRAAMLSNNSSHTS